MPFGKFRGALLADLPFEYLEWLAGQDFLREPLASKVKAEYQRRDFCQSTTAPTFPHTGLASQIINAGYRALALRLHPDAGGDNDSMIALNEAKEWLTERAGV